MILTVTCNPAIDVTYRLPALVPGQVHRVHDVTERVGGKGVNVARVLGQIGETATATGLANAEFAYRVRACGVRADFVLALPSVRRTTVVHTPGSTTSLWEPGPRPRDPVGAAAELENRVSALLGDAHALVVSGSLPDGMDPVLPARLAKLARAQSVPALLDLDGAALREAARGSRAVLLPNLDELAGLTREAKVLDIVTASRALSTRSGAPVVTTLGAAGMVAVTQEAVWHARLPQPLEGNPTGAGDSAAAAISRGLARDEPWPELLVEAVALSAATVLSATAGEVLLSAYQSLRPAVTVRKIDTLTRRRPEHDARNDE